MTVQILNPIAVMFLAISGMALFFGPTATERSWGAYIAEALRSLLVGWFSIAGAGFGVYWLNVYADLDASLFVFCALIAGLWAAARFTPKWLSTTVAGLGLAGMVTYLGLLLADPEVQAEMKRQDNELCAGLRADAAHGALPTPLSEVCRKREAAE